MTNKSVKIILLLPHIDGNRTSLARFDSFINALNSQYEDFSIVNFKFPKSGDKFLGIENSNQNSISISSKYSKHLINVLPHLNIVQSLFFYLADKTSRKLIKPLLWLHQAIYGNDIFTPKKSKHLFKNIGIIEANKGKGIIVAFGGPFGIFSIAQYLCTTFDFKLVLDYRDPWTYGFPPIDGSFLVHQLKKFLKRKIEYSLLQTASLVITVSSTLKGFFPSEIQNKIIVLENGSNFDVNSNEITASPSIFNMVYAGTIYQSQLADDTFFDALQIFIKDKPLTDIRLFFIGSMGNATLIKKLNDFGLLEITEITHRVKDKAMFSYLSNASVFLHLKYGDENGVITSKQADYLAFKKEILLPATDNGDIQESIIKNNAGVVCHSVQETVDFLNSRYFKQKQGDSMLINRFVDMGNDRKQIAQNFLNHINKLVQEI